MTADSGSAGDPVIGVDNLSLTFQTADGPVHALSDIDLTIGKGEFVALVAVALTRAEPVAIGVVVVILDFAVTVVVQAVA